MKTLNFQIDSDVIDAFPQIAVRGFLVDGLYGAVGPLAAAVPRLMDDATATLRDRGMTLQNLVEDPRIRGWREAISRCGLKASTFKGSAEQLGRRLLKDGRIGTPLAIVSAYCAVSARHLAPLGGYDMGRLPGSEVALRFGRPGVDKYFPLAGKAEETPITDRVVTYACGDEVICYAFNFRDSARTCLTPESRSAAFFGEAVTADQRGAMQAAIGDLADLLRSLGAGVGGVQCADSSKPGFLLTL